MLFFSMVRSHHMGWGRESTQIHLKKKVLKLETLKVAWRQEISRVKRKSIKEV